MNIRIAFTALLAVALAACTPAAAGPAASTASDLPTASAASATGSGAQSHEAGAVTVTAEWIAGRTTAKIGLDTHSVDLDAFDLTKLARVRLDSGAWVAATSWDAPMGGHHRSGTLAFGSLDPSALAAARVIELEVRDAPVTHVLRWSR